MSFLANPIQNSLYCWSFPRLSQNLGGSSLIIMISLKDNSDALLHVLNYLRIYKSNRLTLLILELARFPL